MQGRHGFEVPVYDTARHWYFRLTLVRMLVPRAAQSHQLEAPLSPAKPVQSWRQLKRQCYDGIIDSSLIAEHAKPGGQVRAGGPSRGPAAGPLRVFEEIAELIPSFDSI
jgi:hypothetical protein